MGETKSCSSGVIRLYFEKGFGVVVDNGEQKQYSHHPTYSGQSEGGVGVALGEPKQYALHPFYSGQSEGGVGVDVVEPKQYHLHSTYSSQTGDGVEVHFGEYEQSHLHPTYSGQIGGGVVVDVEESQQYPNQRNSPIHPLGIVSKTKGVNFYMGETKSCSCEVIRFEKTKSFKTFFERQTYNNPNNTKQWKSL